MTETAFITSGTYSWTAPSGVTSVSVVAVGGGGAGDDGNSGDGGGGGGGGGGLAFAEAVPVTPGVSYTVVVGAGGSAGNGKNARAESGGNSTFTVGSFVVTAFGGQGGAPYSAVPGATGGTFSFANIPSGVITGGGDGGKGGAGYNGGGGGGGAGGRDGRGGHGSDSITGYGNNSTEQEGVGTDSGGGGGASRAAGAGVSGGSSGGTGQSDRTGGGGGGADVRVALAPTNGGNGNGLTSSGSQGGAGGFPGGGGGGSWDNNTGIASAGGGGIVVITALTPSEGLSANSQSAVSGETVTVTLATIGVADNTLVPYTITGVNSSDINGASLTGNFTIVNNTASVSFLISTSAKKTLTLTSNGFTQTVSLQENIYGLALLSSESNLIYTSRESPVTINFTANIDNLLFIEIPNANSLFVFNKEDDETRLSFTSEELPVTINFTVNIDNLLFIEILNADSLFAFKRGIEESVTTTGKTFVSTDFVDITSFNVPTPEPIIFLERWAG